jgi:hypothetical protein
MSVSELDQLLSELRHRYRGLRTSQHRQSFMMHLRSLAWFNEEPMDYPDVTPHFPDAVHVAYAVCHPSCGTRELIIDGSTQECQNCGSLMFRVKTQEYSRSTPIASISKTSRRAKR